MSKIVGFAKTLRNHWKKSTFFFCISAYGASYGYDRYKIFQMMQVYCEEAKIYGEKPLPQPYKPKHVTVILNPEANHNKARIQFEKFAAPILYLAGLKVSIFQLSNKAADSATEGKFVLSEAGYKYQARNLMKVMSNTDAVIVAGGNGTLCEVVTGLLNRSDSENVQFPLGVIPLGKTNTVANHLFGSKSTSQAQLMAEAAMAVIRETTVSLDVLKIQYEFGDEPVFALCHYQQGAFADIEPLVEKYWYFGGLKDKFTYIKNAFKNKQIVENVSVKYVPPCEGCSKCFVPAQNKIKQVQGNRWWHSFMPRSSDPKVSSPQKDYSKIVNDECGKHFPLKPEYLNIYASTVSADVPNGTSSGIMRIKIHPDQMPLREFVSAGLSHRKSKLKDSTHGETILEARELIIDAPERTDEEKEEFIYVDNEKYSRSSCRISLVPKQIIVYG